MQGKKKRMTLGYVVSHYGYVALFIGVFLEGETVLIAAGFAAHLGHLSLTWVILIAFAGEPFGGSVLLFSRTGEGQGFLTQAAPLGGKG